MGDRIREAVRAANNYAMIGTAKRNGLDPEAYLRYVLDRIAEYPILTMTQEFEQAVVRGKAHWITSYVYEPAASRLVIELTDNVESPEPTRVVEFTDIQQLEIRWTDRDESCIEGLLGAHEEEVAGIVRYLLVTDQREVEFTTRKKAVINSGRYPR